MAGNNVLMKLANRTFMFTTNDFDKACDVESIK